MHNTWEHKYAIRKDNWVLVNLPNGGLYNLDEDIGQQKDYLEKYPEKVIELKKLLKEIRDNGCSAPRLQ